VINHGNDIGFQRGRTLSESIHMAFDQGVRLSRNQRVRWQENLKIRIARDLYFDESIKLRLNRELTHQEMIRKRRNISFSHQVAHVFEKRFSFDWDKGLELVTQDKSLGIKPNLSIIASIRLNHGQSLRFLNMRVQVI
jgi:hypothetical protein